MIHRGEIFEQAVKQTNTKISSLARYLKVDRNTVYNYFKNPKLSIDILMEVGKFMKYDLLSELPEFKKSSSKVEEENLDYKLKYFELLEKHLAILEEQQAEYKKKSSKK